MSASHWQQRLPLSGLHLRQRSLTPTVYSVRISKPWLFTWVWWPLLFECGKLTVFSDHSFYDGIWSLAKRNEEDCALGDRFLQSFDFDVIYIKGNTNFVAEYLLQLPLPTIQAMLCSIEIDWPTAQWADLMVTHSGQFTTVGSLRSLWGIAFYYAKPCTWADRPDTRKLLVTWNLQKIKTRLEAGFWWPPLVHDCETYVQSRPICQFTRTANKFHFSRNFHWWYEGANSRPRSPSPAACECYTSARMAKDEFFYRACCWLAWFFWPYHFL
jgi:hypothetical protein